MAIGQLILEFETYLSAERRYSPHTVTAYITNARQFFLFIKNSYAIELEELATIQMPMVRSWLANMALESQAATSINRARIAVSKLFQYAILQGYASVNPISGINALKKPSRVVHWVAEKPMANLLEKQTFIENESKESAIRDKCVISLLYGCGLRRAELIGLKLRDADLSTGELKVTGKRNKQRIIPMPAGLISTLQEYLLNRENLDPQNDSLLVTDNGKPLYAMYVARLVAAQLQQVPGLSKHNPHLLRHSFATALLNNGASINDIKELLGHSSLASTQIYTHTGIEQLKKEYARAHPKGEE